MTTEGGRWSKKAKILSTKFVNQICTDEDFERNKMCKFSLIPVKIFLRFTFFSTFYLLSCSCCFYQNLLGERKCALCLPRICNKTAFVWHIGVKKVSNRFLFFYSCNFTRYLRLFIFIEMWMIRRFRRNIRNQMWLQNFFAPFFTR